MRINVKEAKPEINEDEKEKFLFLEAIYSPDELKEVYREAELVKSSVNSADPSGKQRDNKTLLIKNFGGLVSEKLISDLLKSTVEENNLHSQYIVKGSEFAVDNRADYQIDHTVERIKQNNGQDNQLITIETRSSFAYKCASPERVVEGAFSIVGPYSTSNKAKENIKDFYAFAFFYQTPESLLDDYKNGKDITVFFAGGATKEMMQDNRVSTASSLKQDKASYRIIKPITKGLTYSKFLDEVFNIKY